MRVRPYPTIFARATFGPMHSDPSAQRILLVTFNWCPKGGVGTRRWSKFAKYLSRAGWHTDVVCGRYDGRDAVNWCHDVRDNARITSYPVATGYPSFLLRPKRTFWVKAGHRVAQRLTHDIDHAQRWGKTALRRVRELLDTHAYAAVVVSVGPFSPLRFVPDLKALAGGTPVIIDFRDPLRYIARGLPPGQRDRINDWERAAIGAADHLFLSTRENLTAYRQRFSLREGKCSVLTNGYDPDDFPPRTAEPIEEDYWTVVHPGSLAQGRHLALIELLAALAEVNDPTLAAKFRVHLHTNSQINSAMFPAEVQAPYAHYVAQRPVLPARQMIEKLARSRFGLTLNVAEHTLTIPSKTFDYLGLGQRIIYLGPLGEIPRALAGAGHYCAPIDRAEIIPLLRRLVAQERGPLQPRIDVPTATPFSLPSLTQQLITVVRQVATERG